MFSVQEENPRFMINWGKELKAASDSSWKCITHSCPHPTSWSNPWFRAVNKISVNEWA
jgi:hypothetical protein